MVVLHLINTNFVRHPFYSVNHSQFLTHTHRKVSVAPTSLRILRAFINFDNAVEIFFFNFTKVVNLVEVWPRAESREGRERGKRVSSSQKLYTTVAWAIARLRPRAGVTVVSLDVRLMHLHIPWPVNGAALWLKRKGKRGERLTEEKIRREIGRIQKYSRESIMILLERLWCNISSANFVIATSYDTLTLTFHVKTERKSFFSFKFSFYSMKPTTQSTLFCFFKVGRLSPHPLSSFSTHRFIKFVRQECAGTLSWALH